MTWNDEFRSINSLDLSDDFIAAAGDNGILSVSQLD